MNIEFSFILWTISAGLCYFIARDRVPSKAALATFFGFLFGPIGVGITFFLNEEPEKNANSLAVQSKTENGSFNKSVDNQIKNGLPMEKLKSMEELKRDLKRLKEKLNAQRSN